MKPEQAAECIKLAVHDNVKNINHQVIRRGIRVKNALRNAELETFKGKRSGRKYRKPNSSRRYTASAPGEVPARRTGTLRLKWTGGVKHVSGSDDGNNSIVAYIESQTPYADYLEHGTKKMDPRPYLDRIKEKALPEAVKILSENY